MPVTIKEVRRRSPAGRAGVAAGEVLRAINGSPIADVLDYRFYMADTRLALELEGADGKRRIVRVLKGEYQDLGLEFDTYLMDRQHACKNKCVFCFVDQTPPGMRRSLYFKDDDARLSFLFGNYITLTNLTDRDIDRIIRMHISPVNISVHTTNPGLRVELMKNPGAGSSLEYLKRLAEHNIKMNTQLVLCPGLNDGPELERSLEELAALAPALESIACVPVGLTRWREGLPPLRTYTAQEAGQVISLVERCQSRFLERWGRRLAYPADEFFLLAGRPVPPAEYYEEFSQLENGVGLLALLEQEFRQALEDAAPRPVERRVTVATGAAAGPLLTELAALAERHFSGLRCGVKIIRNVFWGETITVAGLITGQDLVEQLKGQDLGEELLITSSMLRHEQDRFLDDLTLEDVSAALSVPVTAVDNEGGGLLEHMAGQSLW